MPDDTRDQDAGSPTEPGGAGRRAVDYSRFRMNPVDIEEKEETARATPRRIGVAVLLAAIIAGAVMAVMVWRHLAAEAPPLKSLDPEVRERARRLVDNLLYRIPALQDYVRDVTYPTPTLLRVYVFPKLTDDAGEEREVSLQEIRQVTARVTEEFRAYGPEGQRLTVLIYVADDPRAVDAERWQARGTYDPGARAVNVSFSADVHVPEGSGLAPPGKGHMGARGSPDGH